MAWTSAEVRAEARGLPTYAWRIAVVKREAAGAATDAPVPIALLTLNLPSNTMTAEIV